jgi:large subunit ribosomal protein L15
MGRKKTHKMRGKHNFGRGTGVSHNRGSGNRGGVGNSGSGKKGDGKKPMFWKNTKYFGKFGFGMHSAEKPSCINVSAIEERIEQLIASGAVKQGAEVSLNLSELGYQKLLGAGSLQYKVAITVTAASKQAISKVEAAGGSVTLQ